MRSETPSPREGSQRVQRYPLWLATLALLYAAFSGNSLASEVKDVRLWRAPDHTRVVLDLSEAVEYSFLELKNPRRLVVDIPNTRFESALNDLPIDNTPINRVRFGIRKGSDLRLVFDLSAEVRPKGFALAPSEQTGHRLVIDLFDVGADGAIEKRPVIKSIDQLSDKRDIIIAIDAGHGGEDPGATGPSRVKEKAVVLAIARKLEARLKRTPGFKPFLIRKGDYYVSLSGRRALARKSQADLFVSIHADAFTKPQAHGASVFALSTRGATSTTAKYLADRENAADLVGGVRLSDKDDVLAGVLTDLSMTATLDNSINLGGLVLKEIGAIARLHKKQVEQAGFVVLKSPDIPSILVETGFISNPSEEQRLASASYQDKMARSIERGIVRWFSSHPPAGTLLASKRSNGNQSYTIARGDTLSGIAQQFNVSVSAIKDRNGLKSNTIKVGQKLVIPGG
ncbi:N-acetylmuramoyl-L-alanine amidase AmiC [Luminiphilus syltensis NOR5-1B]|uniref:N-acetylmuramoyl-L-alanine amidase AmiC n=1 Tax=Luminiphilus syltensis NOR5-1B TaxID=565045 RepID=B8KW61_9GAMM|nr:N-acetylmuramoyl-L-alanine amidase [Luminiphilus syltensis]EED36949.1 N-acetylmuramoyl-L-alanine amidase AmiC [Luminiphilus syltensis NOR5-1B]